MIHTQTFFPAFFGLDYPLPHPKGKNKNLPRVVLQVRKKPPSFAYILKLAFLCLTVILPFYMLAVFLFQFLLQAFI